MATIRVLSPIGITRHAAVSVPPIPSDLTGRTVGFLDNTKANFESLVRSIGDLLREQHGVKTVVLRRKANASTPAPPEMIVEMSKECDVVFAGSAD
jgi:hypothetical protein